MRPMSDIEVGDVYRSSLGSDWVVIAKDTKERMVCIQMLSDTLPGNLNKPFWKRNTNQIFTNRIMQGY
jgi:hypothetical protein